MGHCRYIKYQNKFVRDFSTHRKSMLFSPEDKNDAMFWKQIV